MDIQKYVTPVTEAATAFMWWGVLILVVLLLVFTLIKVVAFIRTAKSERGFIEILSPSNADKTPSSTKNLFTTLHGLGMARTWQDKLLGRKSVISLEVVSSKKQGIRYIIGAPINDIATMRKNITAFLPGVRIKTVEDYLNDDFDPRKSKLVEFKQSKHFAFPLNEQETAEDHDPIAYISNQMTELEPHELMSFQIVITPVIVKEAGEIANKIFSNDDLITKLGARKKRGLSFIPNILGSIVFEILDMFIGGEKSNRQVSQKAAYEKHQVSQGIKPARVLTSAEQSIMESIFEKVKQPLFQTEIRALVHTNDKQEATQRVKGLRGSLSVFTVPKYQSIVPRINLPISLKNKYRFFAFSNRMPSIFRKNSSIFAPSELSDIYHFTNSRADNTAKSKSKTLPAPVSLQNGTELDIVFGKSDHNNSGTMIGLTDDERARHVFTIGATGTGKTTKMEYEIVQDITSGKGVAFLDPHGDASKRVLQYIPKERINDVIYFNPDDLDYPPGLNLLELPEGLTPNDELRHKELITEATVSIFRKIFSDDDKGGHRIEYLVRNTVQTALTLENPTLFTIFELLNDPQFRKDAVATLENKHLQNFWRYEFAKAGDFQQVKMSAGVTNKVGRFLFSASAERIIGQPKSTIDFDDVLNSGKILICNLSKGLLGEDTSELFGITILAQLQMAAMRRARMDESDRKPLYLYVDEFQNFATPSFVQLLSEARKYRLFLNIAEQSTAQQADRLMINNILANVGTIICFRTGSPLDEQLLLPFFDDQIKQGEISNLPARHFYAKIAAITPQEPLSGETIKLPSTGSKDVANRVIEASRANFAIEYASKGKPMNKRSNNTPQQDKNSDLDDLIAEEDF